MVDVEPIVIASEDELDQMLRGRVFHITSSKNLDSIRNAGGLFPNSEMTWSSDFGNSINGYFRLRNCVSFFDYRKHGATEWEEHAYKCRPTQILSEVEAITVLFLSSSQYDKLIPWTKWKEEKAWSHRIVPHVEIGYEGVVPLKYITEIARYAPGRQVPSGLGCLDLS